MVSDVLDNRGDTAKEEAIPDINKLEEEDLDISICGIKIPIKVARETERGAAGGEGRRQGLCACVRSRGDRGLLCHFQPFSSSNALFQDVFYTQEMRRMRKQLVDSWILVSITLMLGACDQVLPR